MINISLIFVVTSILINVPLSAFAQQDQEDANRGPLHTNGYNIFQLSSSNFMPTIPLQLKQGEFETSTSLTWMNVFNNSDLFLLDIELLRTDFKMWHGVTDDWYVGIIIPMYSTGGGTMDGLIDSFHHLFNLDGNGRDEIQHDVAQLKTNDQHIWLNSDTGFGDVTLASTHRILSSENLGIYAGLRVQLPTNTGIDWYKYDSIGVGTDIIAHYKIDDILFYLGAGVAYIGGSDVIIYDVDAFNFSALAAVDCRITNTTSFIMQVSTTLNKIDNLPGYMDWSTYIIVGPRIGLSDKLLLEISFIENVITYDNSADVGFHFGIVYKW